MMLEWCWDVGNCMELPSFLEFGSCWCSDVLGNLGIWGPDSKKNSVRHVSLSSLEPTAADRLTHALMHFNICSHHQMLCFLFSYGYIIYGSALIIFKTITKENHLVVPGCSPVVPSPLGALDIWVQKEPRSLMSSITDLQHLQWDTWGEPGWAGPTRYDALRNVQSRWIQTTCRPAGLAIKGSAYKI